MAGPDLNRYSFPTFWIFSFGLSLLVSSTIHAADSPAQNVEFFESKVRPLLVEHCLSCHGADKQRGGLRLDSKNGLSKGRDNGPVVMPGEPDKSKLIAAIRYTGEHKMPPKNQLPARGHRDADNLGQDRRTVSRRSRPRGPAHRRRGPAETLGVSTCP